jgi:hypothetical protein
MVAAQDISGATAVYEELKSRFPGGKCKVGETETVTETTKKEIAVSQWFFGVKNSGIRVMNSEFRVANSKIGAKNTKFGVKNFKDTHLLYANGIRPTRKAVIDSKRFGQIVGGVNYFAAFPVNNTLQDLDSLLISYNGRGFVDCPISLIVNILSRIASENQTSDWNSKEYINALNMVAEKENLKTAKIFVSAGRRITKGKVTMLSEKDRINIDKHTSDIALIMYRMVDDPELGWGGPIWMPNIKLPNGFVFYQME